MTKSSSHPEIYNVPPLPVVDNLINVCRWLERLRQAYNARYPSADGKEQPLKVNSGYRSKMLNRAVGGAQNSNHLTGCAADIRCDGRDANERALKALRYATLLLELFGEARERWDEIIVERKGTSWWVHLAVRPDNNNRCWVTVINKT